MHCSILPLDSDILFFLAFQCFQLKKQNNQDYKNIFRQLLEKGIYTAKWKGNIRVSPHIFNNDAEIEKVIEVLNESY